MHVFSERPPVFACAAFSWELPSPGRSRTATIAVAEFGVREVSVPQCVVAHRPRSCQSRAGSHDQLGGQWPQALDDT